MSQEHERHDDDRKWQRKILNGYWIVVLISFIGEIVALYFEIQLSPEKVEHYLVHTMLIPTGLQVACVTANELLKRYDKRPHPYTIVLTGILVGAALIYGNKTVIGMQYVMMIPMLSATFHFKRRLLTFAYLMLFPVLTTMYILFPAIWNHMTVYERFDLFFILTGQYLILVQLLHRGRDMMERLIRTSRSERDLLVKNTIMERLNKTDALTELYNHRTFQEYLDHLIEQSEMNHMPLQLAVIDIDHFKSINDTFGHSVGDVILRRVAGVLEQSLTSDEIISRYGGEEFTILFPAKTLDQALSLCEHARESISRLHHPEMDGCRVTVSIGLSGYAQGMGKSRFFGDADKLLYQAKRTGKNKTVVSYDRGAVPPHQE